MAIFLSTLFLIICVLLMIVVLLQKGRGGGLGAAFGGGGSSAFGTKTGDVFTWVTIVLTAMFLLLAVGTNLVFQVPLKPMPMPILHPPAGPVSGEVTVSVFNLGDFPKHREIYFTTNGTDPTVNSDKYGDLPITVKPGTELRIRGYDSRGWGPMATATYTLASASTAPATSASEPASQSATAWAPTTSPAAK